MSETERAENPIAEAVRGLMRDRTYLIKRREEMGRMWTGYENYCITANAEIAAIDNRVKELCEPTPEKPKE